MKLLIVEDEKFVRERISNGIDWAAGQIELVAAVENGEEAISILQRMHLDIIVTDIHMPDMDGLELAQRVKREYPQVKLIILTGYDEFEYAQRSIEYNVYKYLVKPITNEQLWEVVQEARELHERELLEKYKLAMLEQRWKDNLPYLQQSFYKNWLNGRYALWEMESGSQALQLSLVNKQFWPIILDMDPIPEGNQHFHVKDRSLVQFSLFTIARDIFNEVDSVTLQDDDGMTAVIFWASQLEQTEEWQTKIYHLIYTLLDTVKNCLKLTVSVGIGPSVTDMLMLSRAYKHSRMALQERITLGNEAIIHFREKLPVRDSSMMMSGLEKELEISIEIGNSRNTLDLITRIMDEGFTVNMSVASAKEILLRMTCLLARIVHAHGWTMHEALDDDYDDFEQFNKLLTREQISEWLQRMTRRISSAIAKHRQSSTQVTVSEVERFVQDNLHDEELNLYLAAEKLYVNYSYLSRTFKKVKGESFSEYVLKLRMDKAKELLSKGCKVYDTAEQVGFRHVNYFSKTFSKYWGIKPSEVYGNKDNK